MPGPTKRRPVDRQVDDNDLVLLPPVGRLADTSDAVFSAALFHSTLADGLAVWVALLSQEA